MDVEIRFSSIAFEPNHRQNHQLAGFVDLHFVIIVFLAEVNEPRREVVSPEVNS